MPPLWRKTSAQSNFRSMSTTLDWSMWVLPNPLFYQRFSFPKHRCNFSKQTATGHQWVTVSAGQIGTRVHTCLWVCWSFRSVLCSPQLTPAQNNSSCNNNNTRNYLKKKKAPIEALSMLPLSVWALINSALSVCVPVVGYLCLCPCVTVPVFTVSPQFGNTCYCNSVLQALYFCRPFRENVLAYKSQQKKKENLLTCLADLFHSIATQKKKVGVIPPKKFISRLRKENGKDSTSD